MEEILKFIGPFIPLILFIVLIGPGVKFFIRFMNLLSEFISEITKYSFKENKQ